MKEEINFGGGLTGIVEVGDIDWTMFKDQSKIHYIGILIPPRFGVTLFATIMEYMYFPPATKKNGLFWLQFVNWGVIGETINKNLYVNAAPRINIKNTQNLQGLKWMIITIPTEYKPQAEACLKKIDMIPAHASPVLSKFKISVHGEKREFPFIAAVKRYKLENQSKFMGPLGETELDKNHIYFFPVEGPNIFTLESGPGEHSMLNEDPYKLAVIESQLCEQISGLANASPEEKERVSKLSKKIWDIIDVMTTQPQK